MPEEIFDLPLHPLVVHAAVVFVPLAAFATLLVAVLPRWRLPCGWVSVFFSAAAAAVVPLATWSGRRLLEAREFGGEVLEKLTEHEQMGDRLIWAVAPLFVLNLATMVAMQAGRPSWQVNTLAVLALVPAVVAVVLVVLTGHLGSLAVWNPAA